MSVTAARPPALSSLKYERPWMYPAQLAAIFCPERYGVIEASTKSGKTAGSMVWLAEQAMAGRAGQNFWWVSPIRDQAKDVFERLCHALPRTLYDPNLTELRLILANHASIWFKGGDHPDSLYGADVYAAVIDEASRLKEEAWHAVRTTLTATKGPIRIIGNVKGRRNWAYRLARMAEAGAPHMHYAKITAADAVAAGILDAAEVADAKRTFPDAVYRELFEAEASDDEGNPFGPAAIRFCTVLTLSGHPAAVWGFDLAKSSDWTVGIALDRQGAVCGLERWNKHHLPAGFTGDYWEATVRRIRQLVGDTPAVVDSTGVGDPVHEAIAKERPNIQPFVFTARSKQQLLEGLAVAIQQHALRFPEGPITAELHAFEYEYTRAGVKYSSAAGVHDDCVIALALANTRLVHTGRHEGDDWLRLFKAGRRAGPDEEPDEAEGTVDREDPIVPFSREKF